jgi:16S rRNA (guanine527-N7)-methyltransferase
VEQVVTGPVPGSVDGETWARLLRVFAEIQRRGGVGRGPVEASVAHALGFVVALPPEIGSGRLVDLGSGGGLPGLVIAAVRPDLEVTLVERRAKRADLLEYGARALGRERSVTVVVDDVRRVAERSPGSWEVVTARSFAAPSVVLAVASALLSTPGWLLVSEPPDGADRWSPDQMSSARLADEGCIGSIHRFVRR